MANIAVPVIDGKVYLDPGTCADIVRRSGLRDERTRLKKELCDAQATITSLKLLLSRANDALGRSWDSRNEQLIKQIVCTLAKLEAQE